jgi:hypothetical protein
MTGLNTKEDSIITLLTATNNKLDAVLEALGAPIPTSTVTLADVLTVLNKINDTLGDPEDSVFTIWNLLGEIPPALSQIVDNIGFPTGDATTTVIGRLAAIERLSKCACPPDAPDLTDPDAPCSEPFVSNPVLTRVSSAYPGRVFAGWIDPPPDGLVLDHFLETDISPSEIVRSTDVSGWSIYIQSTARLASLSPLSTNLVATNSWIDLDIYDEHMAISVPEGNDLLVYICVPGGTIEPPSCYTFTSEQSVLKSTFAGARYLPDWSIYDVPVITNETADNEVWVSGNWTGWTWETTTSNMVIVIELTPGSITIQTSSTGTLPPSTESYLVAFVSQYNAFDLNFCPPEGS